jgi:hypothetical protein
VVGYLPVLTIETAQVAMAEKHVADPLFAADGRLLSAMQRNSCHIEPGIGLAESQVSCRPVDCARAGTEMT